LPHPLYLSISSSFNFPFFPLTPLHYKNKRNLLIPFLYPSAFFPIPCFLCPSYLRSSLDSLVIMRWISVRMKRTGLNFHADNSVVSLLIKTSIFLIQIF
jgi:hypothetical protein